MALKRYLAISGAEIPEISPLPSPNIWIAGSLGPENPDLLILTDQEPWGFLEPERIRQWLAQWNCGGVILDFQRPAVDVGLVEPLVKALDCPVCLPPEYAMPECPVFLPPVPLDVPAGDYLKPWQGREIWLEAALDGKRLLVTEQGTKQEPLCCGGEPGPHYDPALCCHYGIQIQTGAEFTLTRTAEDLEALLQKADGLGVSHAIGLMQELGQTWIRDRPG